MVGILLSLNDCAVTRDSDLAPIDGNEITVFVVSDPPGILAADGRPITTPAVKLPPFVRTHLISSDSAAADNTATLRLEGFLVPRSAGFNLRVFLNHPAANVNTHTDSPGYIGTLSIMRAAQDDPGTPINLQLGIAHHSVQTLANSSHMTVTLVPVGSDGTTPNIAFGFDRIVLYLR